MISNIISLLREILKEIEKDNPYGLIGKGGTIEHKLKYFFFFGFFLIIIFQIFW